MEETKYYTPTIDEFCPGFQFQYYGILDEYSGDSDSNKGWINTEIASKPRLDSGKYTTEEEVIEEMLFAYNYFFKYPNWTKFRVKYLDKEDIESLGFIYNNYLKFPNGKHTDRVVEFIKNEYCLSTINNTSVLITKYKDGLFDKLFEGTIKNKSELLRLLIQLGIDEKESN